MAPIEHGTTFIFNTTDQETMPKCPQCIVKFKNILEQNPVAKRVTVIPCHIMKLWLSITDRISREVEPKVNGILSAVVQLLVGDCCICRTED